MKQKLWCAVHWLGRISMVGTEKEVKKFCKRNSKIYYPQPLDGVKNIICEKCSGAGTLTVPQKYEKILHKNLLPY